MYRGTNLKKNKFIKWTSELRPVLSSCGNLRGCNSNLVYSFYDIFSGGVGYKMELTLLQAAG